MSDVSVDRGVWQLRRTVARPLFRLTRPGGLWDAAPRPCELLDLRSYRRGMSVWRELRRAELTMMGARRGRTIERLAASLDRDGVTGALVDCGTWLGASATLMGHGAPEREVWGFDAFHRAAAGNDGHGHALVAGVAYATATPDRAQEVFRHAGGDPHRLHLVPGWFEDTYPGAVESIGPVAMLVIGCEGHDAVRLTLETFWSSLQPSGFVFVESYGHWADVRRAVDDFRADRDDGGPLHRVDYAGAYWQVR